MLQAMDLAVGYPGRRVGQGFNLELKRGEVLALLGPNGGGKTTLLKTLLGLLPAQDGQVLLEGQPLAKFSAAERARRLAYVPQSTTSSFAFSVQDLVLMGRTAHSGLLERPSTKDIDIARQAIERMGISALAQQPVTQISGGEKQLALIARALAQQAALVVLDEPTASLDFGNQGLVLREMQRLAADGLGVLFTTHDPNHALRFAQRALLVREGRMLASGPVAQVLTEPAVQALYGHGVHTMGMAFLPQ